MKKSKILSLILAAVMIFAISAQNVLAAEPQTQNEAEKASVTEPLSAEAAFEASYLTIAPGADTTQFTFSWHSATRADNPVVRIWKDGGQKTEFMGVCSTSVSGLTGKFYNGVTVTGLEPGTDYTYQAGDGEGNWSEEYTAKTGNPDSFSYLIVGDPQIGASNTAADTGAWIKAMDIMEQNFPDAAFLAGTGDQIETAGTLAHYTGFFTPSQMTSLPFASCMGNHEGSGANTRTVYNPPNADSLQNYWYRYGNALFLVWNCTTGSPGSMRTFLKNAVDANPDAVWKILTFHYDVYGQGSAHSGGLDGTQYGVQYVPVIDEFDIDVVFNGHDHSYNRTYPLLGGVCQEETFAPSGESVDPDGTVYFSLNSSTGSKYYSLLQKFYYTAAMQQANRPHFSVVDMTRGSFACSTYQIEADNALTLIDSYSIVKSEIVEVPALVVDTDAHLVKKGDYFKVNASFEEEVTSNAAVLNVGFDSSKFEYRGFTASAGVTVLNTEITNTGVSFTVMASDYKLKKFGEILFSAKESADLGNEDHSIKAEVSAVVKTADGDKILVKSSGSASFTTGAALPTEISLIELSDIIDLFGTDKTASNWTKCKIYDINNNGQIDIFDIAYFARLVKEQ
jgi:hypothetical protein